MFVHYKFFRGTRNFPSNFNQIFLDRPEGCECQPKFSNGFLRWPSPHHSSRRRPRMASSWRIWPTRILLLWLRRPRRHRRHAAIAAVASPAIGAGARSRSITVLCAAPHGTSQRGSPPRALYAPLLFASLSHRWPRRSRALAPRFRSRANFNPPPARRSCATKLSCSPLVWCSFAPKLLVVRRFAHSNRTAGRSR